MYIKRQGVNKLKLSILSWSQIFCLFQSSAGAAVVSGEDSESEEEDKSLPPLQGLWHQDPALCPPESDDNYFLCSVQLTQVGAEILWCHPFHLNCQPPSCHHPSLTRKLWAASLSVHLFLLPSLSLSSCLFQAATQEAEWVTSWPNQIFSFGFISWISEQNSLSLPDLMAMKFFKMTWKLWKFGLHKSIHCYSKGFPNSRTIIIMIDHKIWCIK